MNDLSRGERDDLARCEAVIERGLATFVEVGTALLKIRDSRLYRKVHGTFEDYCRERWGMSKTQANRMIDAAGVAENLTPMGVIPASERAARPLSSLEPDRQREAWGRAVETAPDGRPTGAHVKAVVAEMFPPIAPLPNQSSFLEDTKEEWVPVPAEQVEKDLSEQGSLAWTKILGDYCMTIRSVEKIGGVDHLTRNWDRERIGLAVEFTEEAIQAFNELRDHFKRCFDERN